MKRKKKKKKEQEEEETALSTTLNLTVCERKTRTQTITIKNSHNSWKNIPNFGCVFLSRWRFKIFTGVGDPSWDIDGDVYWLHPGLPVLSRAERQLLSYTVNLLCWWRASSVISFNAFITKLNILIHHLRMLVWHCSCQINICKKRKQPFVFWDHKIREAGFFKMDKCHKLLWYKMFWTN